MADVPLVATTYRHHPTVCLAVNWWPGVYERDVVWTACGRRLEHPGCVEWDGTADEITCGKVRCQREAARRAGEDGDG